MKKSSYAATHTGECQLCGHVQRLPGGGKLSLHGYSVLWNSFQGTCPGSRFLPYEQSTDLLAGEIVKQKDEIKRQQAWVRDIKSSKNVWVRENSPSRRGYGYGDQRVWRELEPTEYTIVKKVYDNGDFTLFNLAWTSLERGKYAPKAMTLDSKHRAADVITSANAEKISEIEASIKRRTEYCAWLAERIAKWTLRDLTPIPVEEQGSKGVTLHALNAYYSKKTGRDEALCGGGSHSMSGRYTYKQIAKAGQTVTCKACLKALAAINADLALMAKRDALIAEMVTKFGPTVMKQFSDANKQAIKEIRYNRKDLDKVLRKAATDKLERM